MWSSEPVARTPHRTLGEGDEGKGEDQILLALDSSPNYMNSRFDIFVFRNIFCCLFLWWSCGDSGEGNGWKNDVGILIQISKVEDVR